MLPQRRVRALGRFVGSAQWPNVLGTFLARFGCHAKPEEQPMHNLIYIVGFIVILLAVLSFLGLR
jgi:hypothetical protein